MELNWSTFVLEIINFVVLVWILKRFLYQPVLDVIAARRKAIEDKLAEAHTIEAEAEALKQQYTGRVSEWETEKRQAREVLMQEIQQERARRLAELQADVDDEKEKARVAEDRRLAERERTLEQQAMRQGAAFSTRLLEQAAGAELEARLVNLLIEDLGALPAEQSDRLREQWAECRQIDVASAFALSAEQRERLVSSLHAAGSTSAEVTFRRDPALIAGLHIVVGPWILAANVRDELKGFAELERAAG